MGFGDLGFKSLKLWSMVLCFPQGGMSVDTGWAGLPQYNEEVAIKLERGDENGDRLSYIKEASVWVERCFNFHQARALRESLDWIIATTKNMKDYLKNLPQEQRVSAFTRVRNDGSISFEGIFPITEYRFRQYEIVCNATGLHERIRSEGMSFKQVQE